MSRKEDMVKYKEQKMEDTDVNMNWNEMDRFNENMYYGMPESHSIRRSQIPIRQKRFEELSGGYYLAENCKWIIFHHPGHLHIYDGSSKFCILDATYEELECVSKTREMQFRVDLAAFQGAFPQAYWLQVNEKQHRNAVEAINPKGLSVGALRRLPMSQSCGLGHGTVRRRNCASGILETHSNTST